MAKKKKNYKKPKMPRLTKLDKTVYIILIIVAFLVFLSAAIVWSMIKDVIAFSDSSVIAYYERVSSLFVVPFLLVAEIIVIVGLVHGLSEKKPIFGDKKITYGSPGYLSVYPVFMRKKPKGYERPSHIKFKKWGRLVLVAMLVLTFAFVPLSFCGRVCLKDDISIEKYNAFNVNTETVERSEIDTLTIRVGRVKKTKYTSRWGLYMDIKTLDGKEYRFSEYGFHGFGKSDDKSELDWFEYVKSSFSENQIIYERTDLVEELIDAKNLNQVEIAQVYELFGMN